MIALTVVGLLVLILGAFSEGSSSKRWLGTLTVGGIALSLACVVWLWTLDDTALVSEVFRDSVVIDRFGLFLAGTILLGTLLTTLSAIDYLPEQRSNHPEYYALTCFAALGMIGMVFARDMLTLFVTLEVMSMAIYVLAGFKRQSAFSIEAALKYFILGAFGSSLLLMGMAFVYGVTGSVTYEGIAAAFQANEGLASNGLATFGVVMLLAAFAFKIAAAPFHMWVPDVYEGAPSSASGLMAVAVKTAAFGALARMLLSCFGDEAFRSSPFGWETMIAFLAVLSMFGGNLMALAQTNLKRMLAFSAIAHTGYLLVALVAQPAAADGSGPGSFLSGGLLFYLLAYTLANAAAFGVAAAISGNDVEDISDASYQGLAQERPGLAIVLSIAMLSLLGIPATAGFMGKFSIFSEALQSNSDVLWLILVAVLNSIVSAYYYLRVILVAYMRDSTGSIAFIQSTPMKWGLVIATVGTLALGLLPDGMLAKANQAGSSLTAPQTQVDPSAADTAETHVKTGLKVNGH